MNASQLRVLFVGSKPPAASDFKLEITQDLDVALDAARKDTADILLVDLEAVTEAGPYTVARLAEGAPNIPLVLHVPVDHESEGIRAVGMGASDYLLGDLHDMDGLAARLEAIVARHADKRHLNARGGELGIELPHPDTFFWEADAQHRFTWVSEAFSRTLWLEPKQILGKLPWDTDALDLSPESWARFKADVSERRPLRGLICSLADGRGMIRSFRIEGEPRVSPDGTFLGYAGTGTDATREVEHSVRLAKAHEQLMDTYDTLEAFRARVEEDLMAARKMQMELLPSSEAVVEVETRYGVAIDTHFETSSELGGDIWGLFPIDDHRFAVYVADFSGHGVTAALNTFRLHTVIENMVHGRENPGGYLLALNRRLASLLPTGQYATMFYGVVDTSSDMLIYASAACPQPLLADGTTADVTLADGSGLPLGVTTSATYETRMAPFPTDSLLFLYSDALIECGRETNRDLGRDGVVNLLRDALTRSGGEVDMKTILGPFFARVDRPLSDDLTAVRCLRKRNG